jgi:hypothetical protein
MGCGVNGRCRRQRGEEAQGTETETDLERTGGGGKRGAGGPRRCGRRRGGALRAEAAQVGASVFAGVLMMIVLIPINTKISKIQSGLNREIMKLKDQAAPPRAPPTQPGPPLTPP